MSNSTTATVETLTAEVRVLMVGSRQVTLSVYSQLDTVPFDKIDPFGRVSPRDALEYELWVVGRDESGTLVRSWLPQSFAWLKNDDHSLAREWSNNSLVLRRSPDYGVYVKRRLPHLRGREYEAFETVLQWCELPLIVLAGLR